jgi:hypothetical protein
VLDVNHWTAGRTSRLEQRADVPKQAIGTVDWWEREAVEGSGLQIYKDQRGSFTHWHSPIGSAAQCLA